MSSAILKPRAGALGVVLIVVAAVCFATLGPLSRFAADGGVEPLTLVTWRAGIGAAIMVIAIATLLGAGVSRPASLAAIPTRQRWTVAGTALANAALNLAVFAAFLRVSIALALLLFYLYPAMVALVSVAWFGERLDRVRWIALGLSITGLVLVLAGAGDIGQLDALGIGLAFAGGIGQVIYVLAARHGFGSVPGPQAAALTMGGAFGFYVAFALLIGAGSSLAQPLVGSDALLPVVTAGVIGGGVPTVCYITGIRLLGAPRASILATLEPVVAVALAAWLLGERPTLTQLVGGGLILLAAILLQRPDAADHEAPAG